MPGVLSCPGRWSGAGRSIWAFARRWRNLGRRSSMPGWSLCARARRVPFRARRNRVHPPLMGAATGPIADRKGCSNEGSAERQEDLRQVQGHPPARSCDGDLREPASQTAPGLSPGARQRIEQNIAERVDRPPRLTIQQRERKGPAPGPPPLDEGQGPAGCHMQSRGTGTRHAAHLLGPRPGPHGVTDRKHFGKVTA